MPQLDYNINRNFVYSNGQYYKTPKEYFKAVAKVIFEQGSLGNNTVVCDMGCAAGEFLLYLSSIDPAPRYIGFDVDESLITKAQSELSTFTFDVGAIQDRNLVTPTPEGGEQKCYMLTYISILLVSTSNIFV